MATRPQSTSNRPLTSFKALLFDVYGTLIDWETGIYDALLPLFQRSLSSSDALSREYILARYTAVEKSLQEAHPSMLYSDLLAESYRVLARDLSQSHSIDTDIEEQAKSFGQSIPSWPVFPDTVSALHTLSKTYKLVVLSNVDRQSFSGTLKALSYTDPSSGQLRSPFTLILTAQDTGAYKPSPLGFERALKEIAGLVELGEGEDVKEYVLVTAQSLYHDHGPANKIGLHGGAWIDREGAIMGIGKDLEEGTRWGWRFSTLGEMADEVEREKQTEKETQTGLTG
ncbi:HAD-like protein [Stereum hirsutum FP-91666 SS1]|uniref:HAD-like protein n=1 Tax=Stereum hirsutum (strain FP-91666) TaxID=721885 RepID=UPI0004409DC3|nr:HAD-like protein [Stereum hirsutum FP-91666 SS1]EIM89045.1 HAD-like protein [Stereum hirsutum FP-91666 SS1]